MFQTSLRGLVWRGILPPSSPLSKQDSTLCQVMCLLQWPCCSFLGGRDCWGHLAVWLRDLPGIKIYHNHCHHYDHRIHNHQLHHRSYESSLALSTSLLTLLPLALTVSSCCLFNILHFDVSEPTLMLATSRWVQILAFIFSYPFQHISFFSWDANNQLSNQYFVFNLLFDRLTLKQTDLSSSVYSMTVFC